MTQASIPVDLFNPGQVFACIGFLEAAEVLLGSASGSFGWSDPKQQDQFYLEAAGERNPFKVVLDFISHDATRIEWISHSEQMKERDGGSTIVLAGIAQSRVPKSSDLPAQVVGENQKSIPFGYWADGSKRFSTTFKKSTNGASAHVRLKNGLDAIRDLNLAGIIADPLNVQTKTKSLFRLDTRAYVAPIHAGTSPDKLRKGGIDVRVSTYSICEVMAVIGLENARPKEEKHSRNSFRYFVWGNYNSSGNSTKVMLPAELARAAIATDFPFIVSRSFLVYHEEVKRGGDRKITHIREQVGGQYHDKSV